jgi:hypothetical protein
MAAPLYTCTTVEQREVVHFLWAKNMEAKDIHKGMLPIWEQKQRRVTICQDLLEKQGDILGYVVTGDETWVYQYNPETKRPSAQWKTANYRKKMPSIL